MLYSTRSTYFALFEAGSISLICPKIKNTHFCIASCFSSYSPHPVKLTHVSTLLLNCSTPVHVFDVSVACHMHMCLVERTC